MLNKQAPGISDDCFLRGDIPMTKQEVRILTLAKAQIRPGDRIIDIGAGTGSLSVEAALLSGTGQVTAIEREPEGIKLIQANAERFGVTNLQAVAGEAPAAMAGLPPADVVLIGGSGGHLAEIVDAADQLLAPGGRMVITAVTVETLMAALRLLEQRPDYTTDACGIQATRIRAVGASHMFQGLNPVYIIAGCKNDNRTL